MLMTRDLEVLSRLRKLCQDLAVSIGDTIADFKLYVSGFFAFQHYKDTNQLYVNYPMSLDIPDRRILMMLLHLGA